MNTLTLAEAAGFLKMHPEEVRCRAKRGLIPASKPGRRWVFIDDDLAAFLRGKYRFAAASVAGDLLERKDTMGIRRRGSVWGNATVNRTLALVRSILRKCVREWQWLDRTPTVRMLKEPTRRIRYLTHPEADRLLAELPQHLRDMAAFSLASGLRAANVTGLRWSAVNLERRLAWVHPDEAKARRAIPAPLNGEALAVLQKQIGKHREVVFTFKGEPIEQVSTAAWYKALGRAGTDNFRWHDLRHTWASWHIQGAPP